MTLIRKVFLPNYVTQHYFKFWHIFLCLKFFKLLPQPESVQCRARLAGRQQWHYHPTHKSYGESLTHMEEWITNESFGENHSGRPLMKLKQALLTLSRRLPYTLPERACLYHLDFHACNFSHSRETSTKSSFFRLLQALSTLCIYKIFNSWGYMTMGTEAT